MSVLFFFSFFSFLSRSTSNLFRDEGCKLVVSRMEYAYPPCTMIEVGSVKHAVRAQMSIEHGRGNIVVLEGSASVCH